jgi:hypothetical protein
LRDIQTSNTITPNAIRALAMLRGGLFTRYFLEDGIRVADEYRSVNSAEVIVINHPPLGQASQVAAPWISAFTFTGMAGEELMGAIFPHFRVSTKKSLDSRRSAC